MKNLDFPIEKTKVASQKKFDLNDPADRKKYFELKAGKEIKKIKAYLAKGNTFLGFLIGKKNSGKGTYSKLFMEAVGAEHVGHLSVGDLVRDTHKNIETAKGKKEFIEFLKKNYRGFHSPEEAINIILGRSQSTLVSSELIVALIDFELSKRPRQAVFIDGFPRALDQISYSLFLKRIVNYRHDPDFLIFIDVPEDIIDQRIKTRVICPICHTPRNIRLLVTKDIGYDEKKKEFYLMCDDPACKKARMVAKEGDSLGIEPIRERLETDDKIFAELLKLHGLPKIYLRNSVPEKEAAKYVDKYEITPSYDFKRKANGAIEVIESPWIIKNDDGVPSYSLLPAAVVLSMIRQIAKVLGL
jgi:adenylate kinase family enzyme